MIFQQQQTMCFALFVALVFRSVFVLSCLLSVLIRLNTVGRKVQPAKL